MTFKLLITWQFVLEYLRIGIELIKKFVWKAYFRKISSYKFGIILQNIGSLFMKLNLSENLFLLGFCLHLWCLSAKISLEWVCLHSICGYFQNVGHKKVKVYALILFVHTNSKLIVCRLICPGIIFVQNIFHTKIIYISK